MIVSFLLQNRKRRRIARAERLMRATILMARPSAKFVQGIVLIYRSAWHGPTR